MRLLPRRATYSLAIYNIAPTTFIDTVTSRTQGREIVGREMVPMRWGLVPGWWKKSRKDVPATFNARAETVAEKPMFRGAFKYRRCIIPASGFYERRAEGKKLVPMHFRFESGGVMGFAGLWDKWLDPDNKRVFTCCVITTPANELLAPYHDRMPAILSPDDYAMWFVTDAPLKYVHALVKPYPPGLMVASEANPLVNSPKNEGPMLEPAA